MGTGLGEKLREHRKKKGYSLDDLARLSGSSKSYIWELENRDARKPSAEKLTDIAAVLEVTTGYLLDENATFNEAHMKEAFYRKFSRLETDDQQRIKEMIEAWGKKK